MANESDDQRRKAYRPEDNPFIAFRRYADSQVSSLLNTIFTLPATIANHNNAHHARERCLFGKADQRECEELNELEAEITNLRREGRELFRAGDIEEVIKKSEEFIKLNAKAEEIRRVITRTDITEAGGESEKELVQRVGNKKGQEWGWSWDWGFPKPFDHETEQTRHWNWGQREAEELVRLQQEVEKLFADEEEYTRQHSVDAKQGGDFSSVPCTAGSKAGPLLFYSRRLSPQSLSSQESSHIEREADQVALNKRAEYFANTLMPNSEYAPKTLERNAEMDGAGVHWMNAFRDLVWHEVNGPEATRSNTDRRQPQNVCPYSPYAQGDTAQEEDMNYEYEHDHEDQHDDPPTPKVRQLGWARNTSEQDVHKANDTRPDVATGEDRSETAQPATELDVYERLLGQPKTTSSPWVQLDKTVDETIQSSVLSTMTTTERSVAPDGSVITKIVLKKRFADGREESSETVHTQRGREMEPKTKPMIHWNQLGIEHVQKEIDYEKSVDTLNDKKAKKSGWFWSS